MLPLTTPFAAEKKLHACDVLTESEASELAGGPVVASYKDDTPPTKQNRFDHTTVCGFFPKGHDMRIATTQPERALIITLHAMRYAKDARWFYDQTASNRDSGEITTLTGVGDAALMKEGEARKQKVVQLTFVKKSIAGHISTWGMEKISKSAIAAAKSVAAKLP